MGPRRKHPALCDGGGAGAGGDALDKRARSGATGSSDLSSQTELANFPRVGKAGVSGRARKGQRTAWGAGGLRAGARGQTAFLTGEVPVPRPRGLCVISHTSAQARCSTLEARDPEDTTSIWGVTISIHCKGFINP